jgi:hypothetical protein
MLSTTEVSVSKGTPNSLSWLVAQLSMLDVEKRVCAVLVENVRVMVIAKYYQAK